MTNTGKTLNSALLLSPSDGERLTVVGDTVRVLADGTRTGGRCSIFELTTEPGFGPPRHRHGVDDEYFYVLEGQYTFECDGQRLTVGPGAFLAVPRGSIHTFTNSGTTRGRMLVITSPSGIEGPFRATHERIVRGEPLTPEALGAIFGAFQLTFHGPPLTPPPGGAA